MSATIVGHLLDRLDDLGERRAGPVDQIDAVLDLTVAVGDQVLDVLGGLRGALRQAAHLGGHHREAAAGFAGARGFDRGVERQQVGLARDLVDDADDVGDLARGVLDLGHGFDRLGDHLAAAVGDLAGAAGGLCWPLRVLGVLLHGGGDLFHRGGGLLPGWRPAPRCAATDRSCWWRSRPRRW